MKYIISLLFIQLMGFNSVAQTINFNQGETTQTAYFSIVKFENIGGFMIVKATIRGETYRFLLDTGAPNTISKALYEKLKPTILSDEKMMDSNGVLNGTKMVNIEELTFGNIVFNNIPTAVFEDFMLLECLQIDGFIGSNMLRNSIIQISYADETLFLTDDTTRLNLSENHASNMELLDEQSSPYVEIRLRGEIEGSDWVQFDTGFKGFYSLTSTGYDSILSKYPILKLEIRVMAAIAWGFGVSMKLNATN
jgi:predicted aspartyl protease